MFRRNSVSLFSRGLTYKILQLSEKRLTETRGEDHSHSHSGLGANTTPISPGGSIYPSKKVRSFPRRLAGLLLALCPSRRSLIYPNGLPFPGMDGSTGNARSVEREALLRTISTISNYL